MSASNACSIGSFLSFAGNGLRALDIATVLKTGQDSRARKTRGPVRRRIGEAVMSFGIKHFYEKATSWLHTYDVGPLPVPAYRATSSAPSLASSARTAGESSTSSIPPHPASG